MLVNVNTIILASALAVTSVAALPYNDYEGLYAREPGVRSKVTGWLKKKLTGSSSGSSSSSSSAGFGSSAGAGMSADPSLAAAPYRRDFEDGQDRIYARQQQPGRKRVRLQKVLTAAQVLAAPAGAPPGAAAAAPLTGDPSLYGAPVRREYEELEARWPPKIRKGKDGRNRLVKDRPAPAVAPVTPGPSAPGAPAVAPAVADVGAPPSPAAIGRLEAQRSRRRSLQARRVRRSLEDEEEYQFLRRFYDENLEDLD